MEHDSAPGSPGDPRDEPGRDDDGSGGGFWAGVRGALLGFLALGGLTMALVTGYLGFYKDCWG